MGCPPPRNPELELGGGEDMGMGVQMGGVVWEGCVVGGLEVQGGGA